jgi:hypothetical protein
MFQGLSANFRPRKQVKPFLCFRSWLLRLFFLGYCPNPVLLGCESVAEHPFLHYNFGMANDAQ